MPKTTTTTNTTIPKKLKYDLLTLTHTMQE